MRFVEITAAPEWPAERCACCGSSDGVEPTRARLAKTAVAAMPMFTVVLLAGKESRLVFEVPLCAACAPTASRLRPTGAQYIVVWGGVALLALCALVPLASFLPDSWLSVCGLPALFATLACVAWYGTRRPRAGATSYYQPVYLRWVSSASVILGFTHDGYAADFAHANGAPIGTSAARGQLKSA